MPSGLSSGKPTDQEISSFIAWHLNRGSPQSLIQDRSRERWPGLTNRRIDRLYAHNVAVESYGSRFNKFSDASSQARLRPPGLSATCNTLRVSYTATINIPRSEGGRARARSVGFIRDIPTGGTVGDIRAQLRAETMSWAREHYELSKGGNRQQPEITVTGMECI